MSNEAQLTIEDKTWPIPLVTGAENEVALDISALRNQTGCITLDEGFANTGSCLSSITYIDGEAGILRYRGFPIEQLAVASNFVEVAYLLIYGRLPAMVELKNFKALLTENMLLHEAMQHHFEGFPSTAHPMAILSSMINATSCFYPDTLKPYSSDGFDIQAARLISQVRTIAAFAFRKSRGLPVVYPKRSYTFTANFLHMLFSFPGEDSPLDEHAVKALDLIFLLHADHEQNCSTTTVRMVASSRANLYASCASGVCALWGPLHGGANQAVLEMLQRIYEDGDDGSKFLADAKDKRSGVRLMGFGHRVYKNHDPRARLIKVACDELLENLDTPDPLLDIAKKLEETALQDPYFIERKLYPNVDFYSGIIMRAIGLPVEMFPVIFAIGRMPGWIAHYREVAERNENRIYRPRQVYMGFRQQQYVPMRERDGSISRAT
jgi:citrate synthase